jgi:hypothetical protein
MIQGMARFYLLSFLLLLALTAVAMISCLSAEAREVRGLPRGLWVVVILLLPLVGPVLYFAFGRPIRGGGGLPSMGLPPAPKTRPLAPDDDPDFLSRLDRGRPAPGPTPPHPIDDSRTKDAKDDGRTRGDARTKDDGPPTDGG